LHVLLEICFEGPALSDFNGDTAIDLWWKAVTPYVKTTRNQGKNTGPGLKMMEMQQVLAVLRMRKSLLSWMTGVIGFHLTLINRY